MIHKGESTFTIATYEEKMALSVRGMRNLLGLSQAELAEISGVSKPTISRLERLDSRTTSSDTLEKLLSALTALGVSVIIGEKISLVVDEAAIKRGLSQ